MRIYVSYKGGRVMTFVDFFQDPDIHVTIRFAARWIEMFFGRLICNAKNASRQNAIVGLESLPFFWNGSGYFGLFV
jgi:hypothetical protein